MIHRSSKKSKKVASLDDVLLCAVLVGSFLWIGGIGRIHVVNMFFFSVFLFNLFLFFPNHELTEKMANLPHFFWMRKSSTKMSIALFI